MRRILVAAVLAVALTNAAHAYEGHIDGEFKGWEGESIYKLDDGHVIQQSDYHYHYHYAYHPGIIIYSEGGGYKAVIEGDTDQPVGINILR